MFYGNAGFFLSLLHSLCASFPLLAQCHVARQWQMHGGTCICSEERRYCFGSVSASKRGSESKGEETWKISFQSVAKFWGEEETPGKI